MTPQEVRQQWHKANGNISPPRRIISVYADGCKYFDYYTTGSFVGSCEVNAHEHDKPVAEWAETGLPVEIITYRFPDHE